MCALLTTGMVEEGVEGVRELLTEPWCGRGGWLAVTMPFWIEGFDGVRDDGKDDSDP